MSLTKRATYLTAGNAQTSVSVTANDLILVFLRFAASTGTPTCSDNASGGSNSYSRVGKEQATIDGDNGSIFCFMATAKATATLTITCTSETAPDICVMVYYGATSYAINIAAAGFADSYKFYLPSIRTVNRLRFW